MEDVASKLAKYNISLAQYKESLGEDEISSKLVIDLLIGWINQNVYFRSKYTDDDDDNTEHSHKLARMEWNCKRHLCC